MEPQKALEHLADLRVGCRFRANGLMGVAQQHEVSAAEEARHDGKLIGRVVLYLVNHDVARIGGCQGR